MKLSTRTAALVVLLSLLLPAFLAASEVPRKHYGPPIGVTRADGVRIAIGVGELRIQGKPNQYCIATVMVEVRDASDNAVLKSYGPSRISPTQGFSENFMTDPGRPPARMDVVVVISIDLAPRREVERGVLGNICPLYGSTEVYDLATGITRTRGSIGGVLVWHAGNDAR